MASEGGTERAGVTRAQIVLAILSVVVMFGTPLYFMNRPKPKKLDMVAASELLDTDQVAAAVAGVPLVAADLDPDPPVKDSENAAPALQLAENSLGSIDEIHELENALRSAEERGDYSAIVDLVGKQQDAVDLAMKAAKFPRCYIKRDWDLAAELTMPDLIPLKGLVHLLVGDAIAKASRGDHGKALESLRACEQLSNDAGSDPSPIALLLQLALRDLTDQGIERCMDLAAGDPRVLSLYSSFLAQKQSPLDVHRALAGASYIGTAIMRNLFVFNMSSRMPTNPKQLQRSGLPADIPERAYLDRHLELWTKVFQTDKSKGSIATVAAAVFSEDSMPKEPSYRLDREFAGLYDGLEDRIQDDEVHRELVDALAHVLVYKAVHGSYPSDLTAAGITGVDSFGGGAAYHYLQSKGGVTVYSFGPDRKDDAGTILKTADNGKQNGDIVASYPPAPFATRVVR